MLSGAGSDAFSASVCGEGIALCQRLKGKKAFPGYMTIE